MGLDGYIYGLDRVATFPERVCIINWEGDQSGEWSGGCGFALGRYED